VAGGDLSCGTYTGRFGAYDREVFLVLKEFEPSFSRGGDMAMGMLGERR
jgi:hypothetical protein